MLVKKRSESNELMVLRSLSLRMNLSKKEKHRYFNLEKGYQGEVIFDHLLENIHEDQLILNDLLFEINHSYFQIDTLIISHGVTHLIDIKNFEGDCYLEGDNFYSVKSNREYSNPISQLKRCENLFSQLLQRLKFNYSIKSAVIFINPTFTLYQASIDQPIVLPSQVSHFINDLNNTPRQLTNKDKELAQKLLTLHQSENPFNFLPNYSYEELKKGVYCFDCQSYHLFIKKHHLVCRTCKMSEKIRSAIFRHTKEFQLLFPNRKITTHCISEWCGENINKKTIRRVLKQNYTAKGKNSGTYYENS